MNSGSNYKTLSRKLVIYFVLLGVLMVLVLAVRSYSARRPSNLGSVSGKLADCPSSPNCVCSQASDPQHRIDALAFAGTAEESWRRLKNALKLQPRLTLVAEGDDYLHCEAISLVFRFVDDVEFTIDRNNEVIHCRSASRVGYSDLGVNRDRMEGIRRAYQREQ